MGLFDSILSLGASFATGGWAGVGLNILGAVTGGATQSGPRLKDLNIQLDGEGLEIPRTWGTGWHEPRLVYTSGLIEKKKTKKSGGLFGLGGTKTVSYTYGAKCVWIVGRGEMSRLLRLKLNQYALYDWNGGDEQGTTLTWNGQFWHDGGGATTIRVYPGTLNQPIDAILTEKKGANNWTNYPGQILLAVEFENLEKYGNSIPRPRVEVQTVLSALSDVILEIASYRGYTAADFDLTALAGITVAPTEAEGYTIASRKKASEALGELMDIYGFDLPEVDGLFRAVKRNGASVRTLTAIETRVATPGTPTPDFILAQDDAQDLPYIAQILFSDAGREGAAGFRFARRLPLSYQAGRDNDPKKIDQVQMSGTYKGARAAAINRRRQAERFAAAKKYVPSLGLRHLDLAASDRVGFLSPVDGMESFEACLSKITTPLFGALAPQAMGFDPLAYGLSALPESGDLVRRTPILPGTVIVFACYCASVQEGGFWTSEDAAIVAVCRGEGDTKWEGADVRVDARKQGETDWKQRNTREYDPEATIGELLASWVPETQNALSCRVWGGEISDATGGDLANLILWENGLISRVGSAARAGGDGQSAFYNLGDVTSGLLGTDDFLDGAGLEAGARFVVIKDAGGAFEDGPLWVSIPHGDEANTDFRFHVSEDDGGASVYWALGRNPRQNLRLPSPVVSNATLDSADGLSLDVALRSRFYEDFANGNPRRETQPLKYLLTLNSGSTSRTVTRTTTSITATFTVPNNELVSLFGASPLSVTGTVATYGVRDLLGRAARFAAEVPPPPPAP